MKRLISILVLVAMMFTMVIAAVPAWADEAGAGEGAGEGTGSATPAEPVATYNVNWKQLGELGTMRAQWLYERQPSQNNMDAKYDITLTDTELKLSSGKKGGDHRQYYSEVMFDLTADTQYVYEFEVDTTPGDLGGAIFAFAKNPKARDEGDGKQDIFGTKISDMVASYYIAGNLNSGSADLKFGGYWANYGYEDGKNIKEDLKDAKVSEDGYTKYRIVYNGLTVKFYYENTTGEYNELYADQTITLVEGAKLAFGSYTRSEHVGNLRNCVVYAMNDAAAEVIENGYLNSRITLADAMLARKEGTYTPATTAALKAANDAAKEVAANKDADTAAIDAAATALAEKITTIRVSANKKNLNTKIEEVNKALEGKTADEYVARYYDAYTAALAAATTVSADVEAIQKEADDALNALNYAYSCLTPKGKVCTVDLKTVVDKYNALKKDNYTPNSWNELRINASAALGLYANADNLMEEDQDIIDATVAELNTKIGELVKRANFGVLQTTVERAEALDMTDYKAESIADNFADLIENAKAVLADLNNPQATVDEACKALATAMDALKTWRTNVLAIVPADDYQVNDTEKYPNPTWYNKITDMSYHGLGNVYYYDYHKVIAAKAAAEAWAGFEAGKVFPESLEAMDFQGNANYVLRLGTNMSGSGTNRVTDGEKEGGTDLSHRAAPTSINGKVYGHVFGFSFLKAPTVDSAAFYLPTDTKIVSIDVYGAVLTKNADGTILYGKADKDAVVTDADGVLCEDSTTAKKIYLGTIDVPAAVAGAANVLATGDFAQAMKVDYIYFALTMAEGTGKNAYYGIQEVELYGINDGDTIDGNATPDFKAVNAAYDAYISCVKTDYTEESWAALEEVVAQYANVTNDIKAAQADLDAAAKAISDAVAALVLNPVDWTEIDKALGEIADASAYTPKTYEAFKAVYDEVTALRKAENVLISQADAALKALNAAVASLEKRADTTALKAALEEAKSLKKEEWNKNLIAWNMFENSIKAAEALLANEDATQAEVDNVTADLASRRADLKPADAPVAPPTVDPVDPNPGESETNATEKPTEEATKATESSKATETEAPAAEEEGCGGCGSSAAISAIAIVSVIGTAVVIKKKED